MDEFYNDSGEPIAKYYVVAEQLLKEIMAHDKDQGGRTVEITGRQGCGKTSMMLRMVERTLGEHPEATVFWQEPYNATLQFPKIGDGKWNLLIERSADAVIRDKRTQQRVDMPYQLFETEEYRDKNDRCRFVDYGDLLDKMEDGMLNAVFFDEPVIKWLHLFKYLNHTAGWHSIFMDEFATVCPAHQHGERWHLISEFARDIAQMRKNYVTLIYNTQQKSDVDYRVRGKAMYHIYMKGATVDSGSLLYRKAPAKLSVGEAWISYGKGEFGYFTVPPYTPIEGMEYEIVRRENIPDYMLKGGTGQKQKQKQEQEKHGDGRGRQPPIAVRQES